MNNKIPIKKDLRLNEIKNLICKRIGYESFHELLKDNCLNNSAFVAKTLEQLMDQIIFEYHDKASSNEGKTEFVRAEVVAADPQAKVEVKDSVKNIIPQYIEKLRVVPVFTKSEENLQSSGPITLQLEIDTRSVEYFLKGVSFGIKLKK